MGTKPARILVVEDSPTMRELLTEAVGRVPGVVVEEAENGIEALKLLKGQSGEGYRVVFLDLNMPLMDGLKLLSAIQNDWTIVPRCVCVVTTESSAATEEQVRNLGATHFLRKPVSRVQIDSVLSDAFSDD